MKFEEENMHHTNSSSCAFIHTVMMGSNGPNISSPIIEESCGTSNKIVGAILLKFLGQ